MDWHLLGSYSLLAAKRRESGILRKRLQFPSKMYYAGIGINSTLRFTWILKCITFGRAGYEGLDIFLIIAEMFRRWVWVFFRLEREWFVVNAPLHENDDVESPDDPESIII